MLRDFRPKTKAVRNHVLQCLQERRVERFDPAFNRDLDSIAASYVDRGAEAVAVEYSAQIVASGILAPEGEAEDLPVPLSPTSSNVSADRGCHRSGS